MNSDQRSDATEEDREPGVVPEDEHEEALPPGAGTRGDDHDTPGTAGWGAPYEDAPGEGHLAPGADNPPPAD